MTMTASCHCGATKIRFPTPTEVTRCNCTFCARLGAVWAYFSLDEVTTESASPVGYSSVPSGEQGMHYFCATCGNHTHGVSLDWSSIYDDDGTPKEGVDAGSMPEISTIQVNMLMVDDLDLSQFTVKDLDGRNSW